MTTWTPYQEPTRNDTVAVGTSSTTLSNARQSGAPRKVIVIRNTSAADTSIITVNLGANPAVASKGILLRQYESFNDSAEAGYEPFQGTITAICADANGQVSVFER